MKILRKKLSKALPDVISWIIIIVISIVIFVTIFALLTLFGGSIMLLLGLEYNSVWSVILFFIISSVISFPLDIFIEALPKALVQNERLSKKQARVLFFVENTIIGIIVLGVVDYFMDSVTASLLSITIVSIIMSLLSLLVEDDMN